MTISPDILRIIRERRSVRTYSSAAIPDGVLNAFEQYLDNLKPRIANRFRLVLIRSPQTTDEKPMRLGTYGVISGASTYLSAVMTPQGNAFDLGYVFELAVLKATELGLGTVWLGGTFNQADFSKALTLKEGEDVVIVSPMGLPKANPSLIDSAFRLGAGSKNRKPWSELFFDQRWDNPLTPHELGAYAQVLESVRVAPSASNKQPWRLLKDGSSYHLYLERTPGYQKVMNYDLQLNDLGIAACHFEQSCLALGLKGQWIQQNPGLNDSKLTYITTWQCNNM